VLGAVAALREILITPDVAALAGMVVRTLKRDENKLRCSVNLPGVTTFSGLGVAPTRGTSTGTGHYYE
jgi:hypothetical protein